MTNTESIDNRSYTLKRTFAAPIDLVWEAWTKPEHIAQWWAPKGMDVQIVEHKFEEGGTWKYTMLMPDGNEFLSRGVYLSIVKHERIHTSADFIPMTVGVELRAEFEAAGEQTHFAFHVLHPTAEYRKQQEEMGAMNGWGSVFSRLQEFLSR